MNIYMTDKSSQNAAQWLDDVTLDRACTEALDLLTRVFGLQELGVLIEWARASQSNALWIYRYGMSACEESSKRWAVHHPAYTGIEKFYRSVYTLLDTRKDTSSSSNERWTPQDWPNLTSHPEMEVHMANRIQLNTYWDAAEASPVWTNARPPGWARWKSERENVRDNPAMTFRYHYRQKNRAVRI